MNLAELSINKSVITWVMTILLVVVGLISFNGLARLEDPEFTIKEAVVMTLYPGASAAEVEEEVSNVLEKAIQQLGQLDWVESRSSRGLSNIKVRIKDKYDKDALPQVWDELRRKVSDAQGKLPPGAGPSIVNDDFGDVYGVYVAITGEGYTYKEIYEYAKFLQRELLHADDVKRIELYGVQPEVIYVEMRREKMSELGVSQQDIYNALAAKNLPVSSGRITLGHEYLPVNPTGEFKSEQEFGDLLIKSRGTTSDSLVYLKDVATIKRGYAEPATSYLFFNGKPSIGLAIATIQGGNVVKMGEALKVRFKELKTQSPLGMELNIISLQTDAVVQSINSFLISLAEAIAIVIVVLFLFMGLKSGLIIGFVLLITIMGTFIFMDLKDIILERISLGALIIALGMLVDNAIVIVDGMRVKMGQGKDALSSAKEVVGQTGIPLLGATFVAIAAFAAIGTSQDATGEFCRSLFTVIMISLTLSWITAVTSTPLLCKTFLRVKKPKDDEKKDPYAGKVFKLYRRFLDTSIRFRWVTLAVVVGMFLLAGFGFTTYVKQSFFPDSTRNQLYIDFFLPEGTHIDETAREMERAEKYLMDDENVTDVITMIGGGQIRFLLTYSPENPYSCYAQILITVKDAKKIPEMFVSMQNDLDKLFPQAIVNTRMFTMGPSTGGKIQLRINGPDPEVLRVLGNKAQAIALDDPISKGVRNEWRTKVKVLRPQMAEAQARRAGIDRPEIATAMEMAIEGTPSGLYREKDELLQIIARAPESERIDFDNLGAIPVWSPAARKMIPMGQVVNGFKTEFEDPHIWRRGRTKMLKMHIDAREGFPSVLLARIKPKIEQALGVDVEQKTGKAVSPDKWTDSTIPIKNLDMIPLKGMPGYYIAWGGEAEDSARAQASLASYMKIFFSLMVLIVIWLFNSIKKTLIIWLTVPLSLIGVTAGLLIFGQPFGFMPLLGIMSLAGMLIKNAIVLIDQIDTELAGGKQPLLAVIDSGLSRLIPVSMASLTTILGMVPLLQDAFFVAMAVTIMFGLGFATVLTLIVVPVLYTIFFKIKYEK